MPYSSSKEAPEWVKGEKARSVWLAAFNSAMKEHHDEKKAFAIAGAAAKKMMGEMHGRPLVERTMDLFLSPGVIVPENRFGKTVWKEVLRPGKWFHPVAGQWVEFTKDKIRALFEVTKKSLGLGNLIPTPDGHDLKSSENKGYVTDLDFDGDTGSMRLKIDVADESFAEKVGRTIKQMSVGLTGPTKLQDGTEVEDCIEHAAFTNLGVLTGLGDFVCEYSKQGGERQMTAFRVYLPETECQKTTEENTMTAPVADAPAVEPAAAPPVTQNMDKVELDRLRSDLAAERKACEEEAAKSVLQFAKLRQEADELLFERLSEKVPPAINDALRPVFLARGEVRHFSKDGKDDPVDVRAAVTSVLATLSATGVAGLLDRKAGSQANAEAGKAVAAAQIKAARYFSKHETEGRTPKWLNEQKTKFSFSLPNGEKREYEVPVGQEG